MHSINPRFTYLLTYSAHSRSTLWNCWASHTERSFAGSARCRDGQNRLTEIGCQVSGKMTFQLRLFIIYKTSRPKNELQYLKNGFGRAETTRPGPTRQTSGPARLGPAHFV